MIFPTIQILCAKKQKALLQNRDGGLEFSSKMCSRTTRSREFLAPSDLLGVFRATNHHCSQLGGGGEMAVAVKTDIDCVQQLSQSELKAYRELQFHFFSSRPATCSSFSSCPCTVMEPYNSRDNHGCSLVHYQLERTCICFTSALWNANLRRFASFQVFSLTFLCSRHF